MFSEHDHKLIVNPDRIIDLMTKLLADLELLLVEPAADAFGVYIRVQAFGKVSVFGTVADETGVELNRLHRTDERRKELDQAIGHAASAEELFRYSALGAEDRIDSNRARTEVAD